MAIVVFAALARAQVALSSQPSWTSGDSCAADALQQSWSFVENRNYPAAEKQLSALLKDHPGCPDAYFLLGYVDYREQRPKDSLAEYTAGARLRKPAANDLAVVAMDYILLRDYADADRWLTLATEWDPGNALYWYYLGRAKNNELQYQNATEAFLRCLKLHPQDVRAEYNLGLAYAGLGRNGEAAQAYRTAIAWEAHEGRRDPQPWLDMGVLLLEEDHADQAIPYLQQAQALDAANPRIHEELGRAFEKTGKLSQAESEMSRAASLAPNVPSLHYELGRIYSKEGSREKAKEEFARCAALTAGHSNDPAATPNPDPDEQ